MSINKKVKIEDSSSSDLWSHYLEFIEGESSKFYRISFVGGSVSSSYGKIGSSGVSTLKDFPSERESKNFVDKMVSEKLKNGYQRVFDPKLPLITNENIPFVLSLPVVLSTLTSSSSGSNSTVSTTFMKKVTKIERDGCSVTFADHMNSAAPVGSRAKQSQTSVFNNEKDACASYSERIAILSRDLYVPDSSPYVSASSIQAGSSIVAPTPPPSNDIVTPSAPFAVPKAVEPVKSSNAVNSHYLECVEGGSSKFYRISYEGGTVTMCYGKIGSSGVSLVKDFANETESKAFMDKTVAEKLKKGYVKAGEGDGSTSSKAGELKRATIHLFDSVAMGLGEDYAPEDIDISALKPFLKRGDLLEDIAQSGDRSSGMYMYDGSKVTDLADDLDDYGGIGPEYPVYKEFHPYHWEIGSMHVNDILCPNKGSCAGWHGGEMPCLYVDTAAILKAKNLQIKFEGVVYEIDEQLYEHVKENAVDDEIPEPIECPCVVGCDYYVTGFV